MPRRKHSLRTTTTKMRRTRKARSNSWVGIGEPLTPEQSAILDNILRRYEEGRTTSREVYRATKYFGICGLFEKDIPY